MTAGSLDEELDEEFWVFGEDPELQAPHLQGYLHSNAKQIHFNARPTLMFWTNS